jgi:hypothetical protein
MVAKSRRDSFEQPFYFCRIVYFYPQNYTRNEALGGELLPRDLRRIGWFFPFGGCIKTFAVLANAVEVIRTLRKRK